MVELVTNGGFETGSFQTGWAPGGVQQAGGVSNIGVDMSSSDVYAGRYGVFAGNNYTTTLSQVLSGLTVGQFYVINFYLNVYGSNVSDGYVTATFGSSTVLNAQNPDTTNAFVKYTATVKATSTSQTLQFTFKDPNGFFGLDAVSVQPAVCFAAGTLIRTAWGDVPVEDLVVGDLVVTVSGGERPVAWTSHRAMARPGIESCPVRICAGAFGRDLPERDLYLSPGHPVLVGAGTAGEGGHLVPIMCLINGTTIERAVVDEVTYWHVELDEHDILLAEGLPAESYIDMGSRDWFAGADGALHDPDLVLAGMPGRCRAVATDGPVVDSERRRLDQVFADGLVAAAAWPITDEPLLGL